MRLDEPGLEQWVDDFAWSAWRQETRDFYDVASDEDGFQRYLAGDDPAPDFAAAWHAWLTEQWDENRRIYWVRVLRDRPSPYLLFEIEWGYRMNQDHGVNVRILDLTERPAPPELVDDELWMADRARVAVMAYRENGTFQHADTHDGDDAAPWVASVTAAWDAGEPLDQWWDRHPQYHRANWPTAGA